MLAEVSSQWLGNATKREMIASAYSPGAVSAPSVYSNLLSAVYRSPAIVGFAFLSVPWLIGDRTKEMCWRFVCPLAAFLAILAAVDYWQDLRAIARFAVAFFAVSLLLKLAAIVTRSHILRSVTAWLRCYAAVRRVPTVFDGHWLLGQGHFLRPDRVIGIWRKWLLEHPRLMRLNRGPLTDFVVIHHPEPAAVVLRSADNTRSKYIYSFLEPWLGGGLLTACEGDCRARRRPLLLAQGPRSRARHAGIFRQAMCRLFSDWDERCELSSARPSTMVDVQSAMRMVSLDIIVQVAFSTRSHDRKSPSTHDEPERDAASSSELRSYERTVPQLLKMTVDRMLTLRHHCDRLFWRSEQGRLYRMLIDQAHAFTSAAVERRMEQRRVNLANSGSLDFSRSETGSGDLLMSRKSDNKPPSVRSSSDSCVATGSCGSAKDFLDVLLEEYGNCDDAVKRIRDELDSLAFAGHDTTATALAWTLYFLAKNPTSQRKCQSAIDAAVLSNGQGDFDSGAPCYDSLPYLMQCVKESLRLASIVPHIHRTLGSDCELNGYRLLAGTRILVSLWAIHHNPEVWPQPDAFIPERFAPETPSGVCSGKATCPQYASDSCTIHSTLRNSFVPFSIGPRACVGQSMALHEISTVLAMLLRRYDFSFDGACTEEPQPTPMIVMHSANGIHLKVTKRTQS